MLDGPNLFVRLRKWATRQDENFLTESLAVVLEHLLLLAPAVGTRLVGRLTSGFIDVPAGDASVIEIQAQVETGKGRPDLEICSPNHVAWVEVKAESELRPGQLEGYSVMLSETGAGATRLILLTRYPATFSEGDKRPDVQIRWFELADWIETELPAIKDAGKVAEFLAQQFLDFLRIRGMTLTQVGHTLPDGVRALANLLNMLLEAAQACNMSARKSTTWDSFGITLNDKHWVGVHPTDPENLWFGTCCKIEPDAAAKLGVGELSQESWVPGKYRWWRSAELASEEIHFFARTKVSQMEWLQRFLTDCVEMAARIESPNQPPAASRQGEE